MEGKIEIIYTKKDHCVEVDAFSIDGVRKETAELTPEERHTTSQALAQSGKAIFDLLAKISVGGNIPSFGVAPIATA